MKSSNCYSHSIPLFSRIIFPKIECNSSPITAINSPKQIQKLKYYNL